jgi:hypothetical protein
MKEFAHFLFILICCWCMFLFVGCTRQIVPTTDTCICRWYYLFVVGCRVLTVGCWLSLSWLLLGPWLLGVGCRELTVHFRCQLSLTFSIVGAQLWLLKITLPSAVTQRGEKCKAWVFTWQALGHFFFAEFIQLLAEIYLIFAAEPKGVAAPQIISSGDEGVEIIPLDRVLHLQVSILLSERGRSLSINGVS